MEEKIRFTEEEIKEIIASIESAPIDGYGSLSKNKAVYTTPYRKLVALIYAKILSSIEISSTNIATVKDALDESLDGLTETVGDLASDISELTKTVRDKVNKSGDTMNGPLTFEAQGGPAKTEVSEQGVFVTNDGENGTAYDDGAIVNQGKRIVIPLKEGTLALAENVVASVELQLFELDYKLTLRARAADTRILSESTIDLPLESMVVGGAYDEETQEIVLTLQNGNQVSFPVDELVSGLISSSEKGQPNGVASLDADGKVPKEQLPDDIGGGGDEYVKFTDFGMGFSTNNDMINLYSPTGALESRQPYPVLGSTMDEAWKYVATGNRITLTDEEKASARELLGAVGDTDYASSDGTVAGLLAVNPSKGIGRANLSPTLEIVPADKTDIPKRTSYKPITPRNLDYAVKVGVTTNAEVLTDEEKASACDWLGAANNSQPYEIIEKIVVGYSLLTEEPNDWGTNYQSYFTNTGTLREPIYTPIMETAVPAWEQGKYYAFDGNTKLSVNRTAEPNGTSYAFKKVIVYGYCPSSDENIGGYIVFNTDFKLANGTSYGTQNRVLNWAANNNKAYVVAKAEIVNGRISALVGSADNTYLVTPTGMDNLVFAAEDFYAVQVKATKITRMYIPTLIKPNTVIYIHGVRA